MRFKLLLVSLAPFFVGCAALSSWAGDESTRESIKTGAKGFGTMIGTALGLPPQIGALIGSGVGIAVAAGMAALGDKKQKTA